MRQSCSVPSKFWRIAINATACHKLNWTGALLCRNLIAALFDPGQPPGVRGSSAQLRVCNAILRDRVHPYATTTRSAAVKPG